ncbi:MAG TPA: hypothetical protein VD978_11225 [Azospirillum sp.]|nr:hypothetical protein [Azospirillum sp.]
MGAPRTEQLGKASVDDFDRQNILGQIRDHQKTVQLLERVMGSGRGRR